ncbi:MAG: hypothetical protein Q4B43_10260 [Bacteroidota bacterium]|uniref:hypothetical protein n=1 Tax=Capnocytophaga canimorsus TaxID=28188 RepID=UPI001AC1BD27|nr:hypothetical protein [Capnocytophaga canimorsus]MDO4729368.1 hypothetical protein [Bacteroidota bacterium]GIM57777.1 hypothetical protein CAPN006_21690 [Capnocytophaga canimorsus]
MKNKITTYHYGFFIFSKSLFETFLKEKKIRNKDLLSYFDKEKELFNELCLERNIVIPMIRISNYNYHIFVNEESNLGSNWEEVYYYKNFKINVGDDGLWIAAFSFFENWNKNKDKFNTKQSFIGQTVLSGIDSEPIFDNLALHYEVEKGLKYICIKGLRNSKADSKRLQDAVAFQFEIGDKKENDISDDILSVDFNLDR